MPALDQTIKTFLAVERSQQTNLQYTHMLKYLLDFMGEQTEVQAITYAMLVDYVAYLRTRTAHGGDTVLKSATIFHHAQILKSFFNWCVEIGYLTDAPSRRLKIRKTADDPNKHKAIPPEELARFIDAVKYHPRNYAILLFMADTGCRVGGLCSLTLDHLDLDKHSATLLEKGSKWHEVMFGEKTAAALASWLQKRPEANHKYVFIGQGSQRTPLGKEAVYYLVKELSRKTGASREWSPHAIRHAVGHALAKRGVPVSIVQRKLGHSDPNITMRTYYPHDSQYLQQVSEQLSLAALDTTPIEAERPTIKYVQPLPFDDVA